MNALSWVFAIQCLWVTTGACGAALSGGVTLNGPGVLVSSPTSPGGFIPVILEIQDTGEPVTVDFQTSSQTVFSPPVFMALFVTNTTEEDWSVLDIEVGSVLEDVFVRSGAIALGDPAIEPDGLFPASIGPGWWRFATSLSWKKHDVVNITLTAIPPPDSFAIRLAPMVPEPGMILMIVAGPGIVMRRRHGRRS